MHSLAQVLWPIVPFLVEESWTFYGKYDDIMRAPCSFTVRVSRCNCFPSTEQDYFYKSKPHTRQSVCRSGDDASASVHAVQCALALRHAVYQQAQLNVNTWLLEVAVECNDNDLALLSMLHPALNAHDHSTELCELLQVGSVALRKGAPKQEGHRFTVTVTKSDKTLCPRCRRFLVSEAQPICERCSTVLGRQ